MKNGLVIDKYSNKRYYENDQLHRLGGLPAVEWVNGSKEYYENGQLHRLTGPAVEYINGYKEWWYRGKRLSCTTQEEFEHLMKLKAFW